MALTTHDLPRIGPYEPLLVFASGGMATVYAARQVGAAGIERIVVLKRVHRHLAHDETFRALVRREARLLSTVRHPNIVPLIDTVERDGELVLVLEYVEAVSLSELLRAAALREETVPPNIVARILGDALAGLHAAHDAVDLEGRPLGVVHRDVSPHNVLVGVDGTSRLIDFGIAKAESATQATAAGVLKGKLAYMAPEQLRDEPLDRRADVFAAGVTLHEALTGGKLFERGSEAATVLAVLVGDLGGLEGMPSAVLSVVRRALAPLPEGRFETAADFDEALERALPHAPRRAVARLVERLAGKDLAQRRDDLRAALSSAQEPAATKILFPQSAGPSPVRPVTLPLLSASDMSRELAASRALGARRSVPAAYLAGGGVVAAIAIASTYVGLAPPPNGSVAATVSPSLPPASAAASRPVNSEPSAPPSAPAPPSAAPAAVAAPSGPKTKGARPHPVSTPSLPPAPPPTTLATPSPPASPPSPLRPNPFLNGGGAKP